MKQSSQVSQGLPIHLIRHSFRIQTMEVCLLAFTEFSQGFQDQQQVFQEIHKIWRRNSSC